MARLLGGLLVVIVLAAFVGPVWADNPTERFNQGVTEYQAGEYRVAERAFAAVLGDPELGALAAFNLGRAAGQRGDWAAAEYWWRRAQQQARAERLQRLVASRLEELEHARPAVTGYMQIGAGYDSDLTLDNARAFAGDGDPFLDLFGHAAWQARGTRRDGVVAQGSVYHRSHGSEGDYDFTDAAVDVLRERPVGRVELGYGVGAGAMNRGIGGVDRRVEGQVQGRWNSPGRGWLVARYRLRAHRGGNDRGYLDGLEHRLRLGVEDRVGALRWLAYYQVEHHDREDWSGNGAFVSYSPVRQRLGARLAWQAAPAWSLTARPEWVHADYRDRHDYGDDRRRRTDTRYRLDLMAIHQPAGRAWRLGAQLRLEHIDDLRTYGTVEEGGLETYTAQRAEVSLFIDRSF
ncbi:tetratricopeptide repeat protein [Halorhodospira halophila]|uniref:Uncharacterized protein n=1 Tax=Halorhodospira halophila (strain DSM 244 / SL1) TaxID=349124 RepID=A1WU64_HALHL|nr:tetratricopeptide repeat protein [Halorhodospira halophila]ABM61226.1 hypothetical protein Hhal_0438 [Halorhodospira halophila SL1]MBK1730042.1 hypothetical protein [Halorhodospira halophila]